MTHLILRDYAENKSPYPLNSTLNVDRNYADICVIRIVQVYDIVIENTGESIYDYSVYLEECDDEEPRNCTAISKAFPHCSSSSCFLGNNNSYHGAFSLRLDGNDDVIVLSLTLNKLLLENDLYFSLVMSPKNEPDNKNTSTAFIVSEDICEGVLSAYGKSVNVPTPTSNPTSNPTSTPASDRTSDPTPTSTPSPNHFIEFIVVLILLILSILAHFATFIYLKIKVCKVEEDKSVENEATSLI